MFGEIKDLITLKVRALELATNNGMIPPQSNYVQDPPEKIVERAKVYEEYLKAGVNISNKTDNNSIMQILPVLPMLYSMNAEGKGITPEWREFFEKSGIDSNLLDAVCGKKPEIEESKVDDLIDKVNESREIHFDGSVIKEWVHPELRNQKHRYEILRNDKSVFTGDDLRFLIFENL